MNKEMVKNAVARHAKRVDEWCRENGFVRIVTYAIGSWNYNLGDKNSDVDTRSLVVPQFATEITKKPFNGKLFDGTTIYTDNDEQCSILDARKGIDSYCRQCITATEGLFSPYWDAPDKYRIIFWEPLREMREDICRLVPVDFVESTFGYMTSMMKKYEKEPKGKYVMHMLRAKYMLQLILDENKNFKEAFDMTEMRDELMRIKYNTKNMKSICDECADWIVANRPLIIGQMVEKFFDKDRVLKVRAWMDDLLMQLFSVVWYMET